MRRLAVIGVLGLLAACSAASEDAESQEGAIADATTFRCGRGRDDKDRAAQLPEGVSPLFKEIYGASQRYIDRGTVCRDVYATRANRADARMLLDGPEIFTKMAEIVRTAKLDVAIQTFVWENESEAAKLVLDAVRDLAARRAAARADGAGLPPIKVRFLLDYFSIPFGGGGKKKVEALVASLRGMQLDPRDVAWEVGAYHHLAFGNLHVKSMIVDGVAAMIQGANFEVCHDRLGADGQGPWRDSGYFLEGEVARGLLSDFDDAWMDSPTEIHAWNAEREPDRQKISHQVLPLPAITNGLPMMIVTRERDANPFSNRDDNTQDRAFMAAFANAKTVIRLRTPNLNDDKAKAGLIDAAKRGVRVELVLSKGFNEGTEDMPGQGNGNSINVRRMYQTLKEMRARGELPKEPCELFKVRWHSRDGRTNLCGNGDFTSHAKYTSIDDQVVIVGTANMDTQSWNNSREVNVVIDDPATTRSWDARVLIADYDKGIPAKECAAEKPGVAETRCPKEDDVDETKPLPPPPAGVGAGVGAPRPTLRRASGTAERTEGEP